MKSARISDAVTVLPILREESRRTYEGRYYHRLHAILLVAQGLSCRKVSKLLQDSPRTIAYWVQRFENEGLVGLTDTEKPGRPRRLTDNQEGQIREALLTPPIEWGLTADSWNGRQLSRFVRKEFGVELGVRQCQRLLGELGFRHREKERPFRQSDPLQKQG